ncbi:MAG: metallophosphoesterase [Clostridia bacterium]|nr:metallophosphoesterase [Clostridia bacterium]
MSAVLDYIVSMFVTISLLFNMLPAIMNHAPLYSPESEDVKLNCVVVSDTHFDNNYFRDRTDIMRKTYLGIGKCSEDIDVMMNLGDITNSGSKAEYRHANVITKTYVKPKNYVACIGNHDSWNGSADPDFDTALSLYFKHLKAFGIKTDKVYYSQEIEGYWFICLGSESIDIDDCPLNYSEEQLQWFNDTLAQAVQSEKPVFVLNHKPIAGHNGVEYDYGLPSEIEEIMNKYDTKESPVLYFSGHRHTFAPENAFERDGDVYYLNLPSTEYNDDTIGTPNDNGGMGVTMEVYENKIVIKYRNFIKNEFVDGFRFEIEL